MRPKTKRLSITIREIPDEVHREWKAKSAIRGLAMDQAVVEALRLWIAAEDRKRGRAMAQLEPGH